jgi:hypothetical protein
MVWEWWNFFLPPIPIAAPFLPAHLIKIEKNPGSKEPGFFYS